MTKQEFLAFSLPYDINILWRDGERVLLETRNIRFIFQNDEFTKPICCPLSDLTKEIEHNGERFVPIVRLLEIAFGGEEIDTNRVKLSFEDDMYIVKINELEFGFDTTDNSFVSYLHSFASYIPSQLLLFQKLIEWHFDLFDGIKNEEAIDVNTLEENPYK